MNLEEVLEVLELDDSGVRDFLQAYGSENLNKDFALLVESPLLHKGGVGRNPYWLKMMIALGLYTRNRGALFENFARELVRRELNKTSARPSSSVVPVDDELDALAYLANVMSLGTQIGLSLERAEKELTRWLEERKLQWTSRQVLNEAEAATLMRLSQREDRTEFVHQLVQEFFLAYSIRLNTAQALRQARDYGWWRSILMLGGILEEHTIDEAKHVGRHDDYYQFVQRMLSNKSNIRQIFLAVGLLKSVDKLDKKLEDLVIASLTESLHGGVTPEHKQAARNITEIGGDDVVELFGVLLERGDLIAKEAVLDILEETSSKKRAQILVASLGDKAISTRISNLLVSMGELAVEPLIVALQTGDRSSGQMVAEILISIGEIAVAPLITALQNREYKARQIVAWILGMIAETRAVDSLLGVLQDTDPQVRQTAVRALGKIGERRAVGPFLRVLQDTDPQVRQAAAEALEEIGETRAIAPFNKALQDADITVRQVAAQVLREGDSARAERRMVKMLLNVDPNIGQAMSEALQVFRGGISVVDGGTSKKLHVIESI